MNTGTKISQYYESIEFNVTTGTTDYNVDTQQSDFMTNFKSASADSDYATHLEVSTDQTISIKLNETTNHARTITSTESPTKISGLAIRNIFITNNSGNTAAVKLWLQANPN